ncbi:hypothetical protein CERSUDRAFT_92313 [Gelatoporia subvermispora B]|uniref:Uncharacterized protein n=1 Tax=Ceriporiopsis subvermispora (strain B) TaxID=914234 RepID=M2QRV7_CERS8|nr:hypothetical protein CERSUDRAFT_92313 [Gelatoporia subvermispora B]
MFTPHRQPDARVPPLAVRVFNLSFIVSAEAHPYAQPGFNSSTLRLTAIPPQAGVWRVLTSACWANMLELVDGYILFAFGMTAAQIF